MIKQDYRLIGLSAPKSGTLELLTTDKHTFWGVFDMADDRYKALFKWAKEDDDFWKTAWIAECWCEGVQDDGTPINAIITDIRQWDKRFKPFGMPDYDMSYPFNP